MSVRPVLIYPENRDIAFSNLAVHWFFNAFEKYSPDLITLDSETGIIYGSRLDRSPFVFVSISYGLSYFNLVKILKKNRIPLLKKDRDAGMFPILIAGGVAVMLNPEPLNLIFDAVFTGEGECMEQDILTMLELNTRDEVFDFINKLPYALTSERDRSEYVYAKAGSFCVSSNDVLHSYGNCFNNRNIIEISRGCTNRCRFCAASYLYRTFREADSKEVMRIIENSIAEGSGIALMGASLASCSFFDEILEKCSAGSVSISLSSLKAAEITEARAVLLKKCGVKTVTVAVESADEDTRAAILKNLPAETIVNAMTVLKKYDLRSRIYIIAGLPSTEPVTEAEALINLLEELDRRKLLNGTDLSVAPFAPKPFTPYQHESIMSKKEYKIFADVVRKGLLKLDSRVKAEFFPYRESVIDVNCGRLKGNDFIKMINGEYQIDG